MPGPIRRTRRTTCRRLTGYYVGNALLTGMAFGAGLAITNSLWGGYNWGRNDVDININRYNNVNVNRRISSNQNTFSHNRDARKGVPYRDAKVNDKYGKNVAGKDARNDYRGRDANDAKRDAARDTMAQRVDPKAREQLERQAGQRPAGAGGAQDRMAANKDRPGNAGTQNRTAAAKDRPNNAGAQNRMAGNNDRAASAQRPQRPAPASRENALSGAGNGNAQRAQVDRGQASRQASAAARPQQAARPAPRAAAQRGTSWRRWRWRTGWRWRRPQGALTMMHCTTSLDCEVSMSRPMFPRIAVLCLGFLIALLPTLGHAQQTQFPSAEAAAAAFVDALAIERQRRTCTRSSARNTAACIWKKPRRTTS